MIEAEPASHDVGPRQFSIATLIVSIVGLGSFLALVVVNARSSPAWTIPVSCFCFSVALFIPGAALARIGRLRGAEIVYQLALVTLLWNVATWPPAPVFRVFTLLAVPIAMLIAVGILNRTNRQGRLPKVLAASAWTMLLSFVFFLAVARLLNVYGYVRTP